MGAGLRHRPVGEPSSSADLERGRYVHTLDFKGDPLTDQARTVEGIRRPSYGRPEIQMTVNDPKAYTQHWSATRYVTLAIYTELIEDICNENEKSMQHMVGK